ncbi:hypothetical protein [Hymenopteran arli-related virus OKIAV100]|uniref:Uncharacterized protein n=1 Tax=Hymenopteran arli-related virus OKIAV100 TaxID=2792564 RepID=A0A7T0M3H7_9MONO|nr:hypothetical protein [Hymenopteran arli-related virus OKIAV100]
MSDVENEAQLFDPEGDMDPTITEEVIGLCMTDASLNDAQAVLKGEKKKACLTKRVLDGEFGLNTEKVAKLLHVDIKETDPAIDFLDTHLDNPQPSTSKGEDDLFDDIVVRKSGGVDSPPIQDLDDNTQTPIWRAINELTRKVDRMNNELGDMKSMQNNILCVLSDIKQEIVDNRSSQENISGILLQMRQKSEEILRRLEVKNPTNIPLPTVRVGDAPSISKPLEGAQITNLLRVVNMVLERTHLEDNAVNRSTLTDMLKSSDGVYIENVLRSFLCKPSSGDIDAIKTADYTRVSCATILGILIRLLEEAKTSHTLAAAATVNPIGIVKLPAKNPMLERFLKK